MDRFARNFAQGVVSRTQSPVSNLKPENDLGGSGTLIKVLVL